MMTDGPMTVEQIKQIRVVTRNYGFLRGLQVLPMGALFLGIAAFRFGWLRLPDQFVDYGYMAVLIGFCIALVLYPLIGDYYDRRFGIVRQTPTNRLETTMWFMLAMVLLVGGIRLDSNLNLPFSATGLALALWFFILWWRSDAFRTHILAIAIFIGLLSLLPLVGISSFSKLFLVQNGGYMFAFGLLLTLGGICDHLVLVRTFRGVA